LIILSSHYIITYTFAHATMSHTVEQEAVQKSNLLGTRVLRDQLYPVKVDNANRLAVLDATDDLQPGVVEILEKENEVKITKLV
jgi:hypothetical protein